MKKNFLALAATLGFLSFVSPASAAVNLLTNGGFESGDYSGANFDTLSAGSLAITGWTIGGNSIDWVASYWQAAEGIRSVDLSGTGLGSVSQDFTATAGQKYLVSFFLSGNPDGSPTTKQVSVDVDGVSQIFNFVIGGNSHSDMQWQPYSFLFTANQALETLKFTSLASGDGPFSYGAALDNVTVSAVPELSTWAMMLLGFAGIGFFAYRNSKRAAIAVA